MATVKVTSIKRASERFDYMQEEAHFVDEYVGSRNAEIGGNVNPKIAPQLFDKLARANGNNSNDLYQIIQSFDISEFDYKDYDPKVVNKLGRELADKVLKDKGVTAPYVVYTQADGASHHVHNHILICNYTDKHKSIPKGLSFFKVAKANDDVVTAQYSPIQDGLKAVREYHENEERSPLNGHYHGARRDNKDRKEKKDILASDVKLALSRSRSRQQFEQELARLQIRIVRSRDGEDGWLTKKGKFRKNITFYRDGIKARSSGLLNMTAQDLSERLEQNAAKPVEKEATAVKTTSEENVNKRRQKRLRITRQEQSQTITNKPKPQPKKLTEKEYEKRLEEMPLAVQLKHWQEKLHKLMAKGKNDSDKEFHNTWQKVMQLNELVADEQSQKAVNTTQYNKYNTNQTNYSKENDLEY